MSAINDLMQAINKLENDIAEIDLELEDIDSQRDSLDEKESSLKANKDRCLNSLSMLNLASSALSERDGDVKEALKSIYSQPSPQKVQSVYKELFDEDFLSGEDAPPVLS